MSPLWNDRSSRGREELVREMVGRDQLQSRGDRRRRRRQGRDRRVEGICGADGERDCASVFVAGGSRGSGAGGVCCLILCGGSASGAGVVTGSEVGASCRLGGRRSAGVGGWIFAVIGSGAVEVGRLRGGGIVSAGVCASRERGNDAACVCAPSPLVAAHDPIVGAGVCDYAAVKGGARGSSDGLLAAFGASAVVGAILQLLWLAGQHCGSRLRGQCCGGTGCWVWAPRRKF